MSTSPTSEHEHITPPRRKRTWRDHVWSGFKWLALIIFCAYLWSSFVRTEFNMYTLIAGAKDIKRVMSDLAHPDLSWYHYDDDGEVVRDLRTAPNIATRKGVDYSLNEASGISLDEGILKVERGFRGGFTVSAEYQGRVSFPERVYFSVGLNPSDAEEQISTLRAEEPKLALILGLASPPRDKRTKQLLYAMPPGDGTRDYPYVLEPDIPYQLTLLDQRQARPKRNTLPTLLDSMNETVQISLIGTLIAVIFSFPLAFFASRNLTKGSAAGLVLYGGTRFVFNVLRAFPPFILAIIFVFMVGPGPFPGVLALGLHSIGMLGKLFSEAIESVDPAPIEAVKATGASDFLVVWYGILPQVVPQFLAFSLYRWDINIRMSIILGIVGAGGIGFLLDQYIRMFKYSQASTCFLIILVAVTVLDYASAWFRERLG